MLISYAFQVQKIVSESRAKENTAPAQSEIFAAGSYPQ
jgi:hypothetical protein